MTNKEFEAKKQEIIDYIADNLTTSSKVQHLLHVDKMLDALQPPRPTCAMCTERDDNGSMCAYWDYANEWGRKKEEFGCILHSDYGGAK